MPPITGPSGNRPTSTTTRPADGQGTTTTTPSTGATTGTTTDPAPPGPGASTAPFQTDGFDPTRPAGTTTTGPGAQKMDGALESFRTRLEDTLNHDALSMARGETPWRPGDPLTADQQKSLQGAATDLAQNIPLGQLSPAFMQSVQSALDARGIHVDNLGDKSLKDLSKVAGDVAADKAKELGNQLKDWSPAAFYGLLGGAAIGVGVYGYAKGSEALEKLGIKPELKKGFFDDRLEVRVRGAWEGGFKNPTVGGSLKTNLPLSSTFSVTGEANFDKSKFTDARVGTALNLGSNGALGLDAAFNDRGLSSFGASYAITRPEQGFSLSAGARHDVQLDRTTADLTMRYQPSSNLDFALSGSVDTRGESRVGVGVRWRF